jgi:hypothetical protein
MDHYRQYAIRQLSPVCPSCGSHRTQVVGQSSDAQTITIRCVVCGNRSTIDVPEADDNTGRAVEGGRGPVNGLPADFEMVLREWKAAS